MTSCAKKNRLAKSILAALGGVGWLCLLATAAVAQTAMMPSSLPLYFEANQGQVDSPAQFIARGRDSQFLISPASAQITLCKATASRSFLARTVRMQFVGANDRAQISGTEELSGKINYLVGNNPARWQTGVATFAKVRVGEIYPGVNLTYYGNQRQLEYDFTVAPGADPVVVAIRFDGADKIFISPAGELVLNLDDREIRQPKPVIYQIAGNSRKEISGGYKIVDAHTVAFAVGDYDHRLPLVIDPILSYSTYFGGTADDIAWRVAVDTNGFVYVAGETLSVRFAANTPLSTTGAFQTNYAGGSYTGDAFVAKFSNDGSNLVYFTYLGGNQDDLAIGLAVDNSGDAFVTGFTDSPNFPTYNALYGKIGGPAYYKNNYYGDAFVSELDPTGSHLIYSTYLGGSSVDVGYGVAVDSAGNAYVAGYTSSPNFPTTNSLVYQLSGTNITFNYLSGYYNAFLAKIGPGGSPLIYSTYFGGNNIDVAEGVAVDSTGAAYLVGFTDSPNFPTNNPVQPYLGGATNAASGYNAFVAKFAPSGTNLIYSTFLGGMNNDFGFGIAVDTNGNAYVTGAASSPNFTNTAVNVANLFNELTNNQSGSLLTTNVFLTQITSNGGIGYSAVFGGFGRDVGYGVAVDPAGEAFVVGTTSSTNFPTLNASGLLASTNSGGNDVFVTAFNTNGTALLYSVYLGGANDDFGYGIAVDQLDSAYVVGQTLSANFPATNNVIATNALYATLNGPSDAFLAKIFDNPPSLIMSGNNSHVQVAVNANAKFEPELPRLFRLESTTNLFSTNWVAVPQPMVVTNNRFAVTVNPTNKMQFFRLHAF
jgi:hypothetical protein